MFLPEDPQSPVQNTAKIINSHDIQLEDLCLHSCGAGDNPEKKHTCQL